MESAGLSKIYYIFAAATGIMQMLPFILENLPFPFTIAIFLNEVFLEIKSFSIFSNRFTHLFLNLTPFYCRLHDMESHFFKDAYEMFHIYTTFLKMICLDDTLDNTVRMWYFPCLLNLTLRWYMSRLDLVGTLLK